MRNAHEISFELAVDDQARKVLRAVGDVDLQTGPSLRRQIERVSEPGETLVLDLRDVTFMDSPGLGMLIYCERRQREWGGRLVIMHPAGPVRDLFDVVGLADLIEIE